jgi:hypothetical protein
MRLAVSWKILEGHWGSKNGGGSGGRRWDAILTSSFPAPKKSATCCSATGALKHPHRFGWSPYWTPIVFFSDIQIQRHIQLSQILAPNIGNSLESRTNIFFGSFRGCSGVSFRWESLPGFHLSTLWSLRRRGNSAARAAEIGGPAKMDRYIVKMTTSLEVNVMHWCFCCLTTRTCDWWWIDMNWW